MISTSTTVAYLRSIYYSNWQVVSSLASHKSHHTI